MTTATMTREEAIRKYINECDTDTLLSVVTDVNSYDGYFDWLNWFDMEELDMYLEGYTPTEIAQKCQFGDFNINDEYFRFDGYENLESCNDYDWDRQLDDSRDEIAEYLLDFKGGVWDKKLQAMLYADDDTLFDATFDEILDDDDDDE